MAKKYGITAQSGKIDGLEAAVRKMDALREAIEKGTRAGIMQVMNNVLTRAKLNAAAVDPLIANAIVTETEQQGERIQGRVFVTTGPYGDVPMPVFREMGTGPQGIASTGGQNGPKYPLPSSAYTQKPWVYYDTTGKYTGTGEPGFVHSDGMPANPYMWPAIQAELPFAQQTIIDAINRETRRLKGGG